MADELTRALEAIRGGANEADGGVQAMLDYLHARGLKAPGNGSGNEHDIADYQRAGYYVVSHNEYWDSQWGYPALLALIAAVAEAALAKAESGVVRS